MTKDKITTLIGWSIFLLLFYFMGPSVAFMFGVFYLGGFYLSKVTEIKDQKVGIRYFILCFSFMFLLVCIITAQSVFARLSVQSKKHV